MVERDHAGDGTSVSGERTIRQAKFAIGQIVRHRFFPFRGVIYDVDPVFANTEEWYQAIPAERRPSKDQPFYHLLARNEQGPYEAYVSEQNLLPDAENGPVAHPMIETLFEGIDGDRYVPRPARRQ
jgi:heat shock protein HspQ